MCRRASASRGSRWTPPGPVLSSSRAVYVDSEGRQLNGDQPPWFRGPVRQYTRPGLLPVTTWTPSREKGMARRRWPLSQLPWTAGCGSQSFAPPRSTGAGHGTREPASSSSACWGGDQAVGFQQVLAASARRSLRRRSGW